MAVESKIQWTNATWNPWHGCKKVSPGCKFCYMYRDKERYGHDPTTVLKSKSKFDAPLKWNEGKLIFTCSWSDWFIEEADEWRPEAWEIIKATPHHTYQILTKRPERIHEHLPDDWGTGYDNVWLGVSIESQEQVSRIHELILPIGPGIKFLSIEPMIGPVDLNFSELMDWGHTSGELIDWVIIGGESGNEAGKYGYRECKIEWIESVIDQCKEHEIPVFVKQLGTYLAKEMGLKDRHGGNIDEWPENLQIREFPKIETIIQ